MVSFPLELRPYSYHIFVVPEGKVQVDHVLSYLLLILDVVQDTILIIEALLAIWVFQVKNCPIYVISSQKVFHLLDCLTS